MMKCDRKLSMHSEIFHIQPMKLSPDKFAQGTGPRSLPGVGNDLRGDDNLSSEGRWVGSKFKQKICNKLQGDGAKTTLPAWTIIRLRWFTVSCTASMS